MTLHVCALSVVVFVLGIDSTLCIHTYIHVLCDDRHVNTVAFGTHFCCWCWLLLLLWWWLLQTFAGAGNPTVSKRVLRWHLAVGHGVQHHSVRRRSVGFAGVVEVTSHSRASVTMIIATNARWFCCLQTWGQPTNQPTNQPTHNTTTAANRPHGCNKCYQHATLIFTLLHTTITTSQLIRQVYHIHTGTYITGVKFPVLASMHTL